MSETLLIKFASRIMSLSVALTFCFIASVLATNVVIRNNLPQYINIEGKLEQRNEIHFKACGIDRNGLREMFSKCSNKFGPRLEDVDTSYNISGVVAEITSSDVLLTDYYPDTYFGHLTQQYRFVASIECGKESHSIEMPRLRIVGDAIPDPPERNDEETCTLAEWELFNETREFQPCMGNMGFDVTEVFKDFENIDHISLVGEVCSEILGCGKDHHMYNFFTKCYQVFGKRKIHYVGETGENPQLYYKSIMDIMVQNQKNSRRKRFFFFDEILAWILAGLAYDTNLSTDSGNQKAFKTIDRNFEKQKVGILKIKENLDVLGDNNNGYLSLSLREARQKSRVETEQRINFAILDEIGNKLKGIESIWLHIVEVARSKIYLEDPGEVCSRINETLVTVVEGMVVSTVVCSPMGKYPYCLNGTYTDLFSRKIVEDPCVSTNVMCTRLLEGNRTEDMVLYPHLTVEEIVSLFGDGVFKDPKYPCERIYSPTLFIPRISRTSLLHKDMGQKFLKSPEIRVDFESALKVYEENMVGIGTIARAVGKAGRLVLVDGTKYLAKGLKFLRTVVTKANPFFWLFTTNWAYILAIIVTLCISVATLYIGWKNASC